jgi:N-carbamoyl-L-amino-acid hydrolase
MPESVTPRVEFDAGLRGRLAAVLGASRAGPAAGDADGGDAGRSVRHAVPVLSTGAGHDAGVIAARLHAAMLFVRNPTGVSHSPAEHANPADCEAGVVALAAVLEELAGR